LAKEKYNTNYSIKSNSDNTYFLVVKKVKKNLKLPDVDLDFFVFSVAKNKIVYKLKLEKGQVKWADSKHLSISLMPGIITKDENKNKDLKGYYFNVETLKKETLKKEKLKKEKLNFPNKE